MLVQYLAATTYAFTTMLATVLAGIAIGGAMRRALLRRMRDWVAWLAYIQLATACAVLGSAIFLGWSYAPGGEPPAISRPARPRFFPSPS